MITILIWMTGTVVSVMTISLQKETMDEITRDYNGDIFTIISSDCQKTSCDRDGRYAAAIAGSDCKCQCAPSHQIFREDINQCVEDLIECPLAAFIRPYLTERIPVVSLPVSSGQLIHPGAHLTISGLTKLINTSAQLMCQIDSSEMMTTDGWQGIGAHSDLFELYEDGNNTFLQWVGSDSLRKHLHQKLVLIRLSCSASGTSLYKPCIAIRIGWVPGVSITSTNLHINFPNHGNKVVAQQSNNYLIIGLCLGLLGLMYVLALMIYIRTKKSQLIKYRNTQNNNSCDSNQIQLDSINRMENGNNNSTIISNVTTSFSTNFSESQSFNSGSVINDDNNEMVSQFNIQSQQNADIENENFESKNEMYSENERSVETEQSLNENQSNHKIVIPERISKRCLHINPEYFEPELLLEPPPPAIEFLQRIRELITNAKGRIKNFRFKPTLLVIPEDDYFYQDLCKSSDTKCTEVEKKDEFSDEIPIPPPRHGKGKRVQTPIVGRKDCTVITTHTKLTINPMKQINECNCDINNFNPNFKEYEENEDSKIDERSKCHNNSDNEVHSSEIHNNDKEMTDLIANELFSTQTKISRKEMLIKLKNCKPENCSLTDINGKQIFNNLDSDQMISEITICDESDVSSDKSLWKTSNSGNISLSNSIVNIDEDDTPLDSLKLLSAKVAKKLSEGSVPELSYKPIEMDHNSEQKNFQYWMKDFRNSFGKLSQKSKTKLSFLKTNDNWTLQRNSVNRKGNCFETDGSSYPTNCENHISGNETSSEKTHNLIKSKLSTEDDINSISNNSCHCQQLNIDLRNVYSDFDQNFSLESNENNELNSFQSMKGYDCDVGTSTDTSSISSGEVSTTSSFKGNQLTSLESIDSDLTDDSLNISDNYKEENKSILKKNRVCESSDSIVSLSDLQSEDDDNPIEACLKQLANTPIDANPDKYYLKIDRATKGMSALHKIKSSNWKHICVQNHSQKEHKINDYQSDETTSSTATSNNSMAYRATDDMTCYNDRKEPTAKPSVNCKRRSSRMLGYASQDSNSLFNEKTNPEFCSKYSKPKSKTSKNIRSLKQTNCSANNFNKLLTRHPKCTTKFSIYRGPPFEDEICRNANNSLNGDYNEVETNGLKPVEDMSSDESNSFVRKISRQKKLTNGTCKQYIQQRLKTKDENHFRNTLNSNDQQLGTISQTCSPKELENDNQLNHIGSNHKKFGPKGTVIEVNEGLNSRFVTRIPV